MLGSSERWNQTESPTSWLLSARRKQLGIAGFAALREKERGEGDYTREHTQRTRDRSIRPRSSQREAFESQIVRVQSWPTLFAVRVPFDAPRPPTSGAELLSDAARLSAKFRRRRDVRPGTVEGPPHENLLHSMVRGPASGFLHRGWSIRSICPSA